MYHFVPIANRRGSLFAIADNDLECDTTIAPFRQAVHTVVIPAR